MFMSHHQIAGQNHNMKAANKSSKNVAKFKYNEKDGNKIAFMKKLREY
jgi:hypothetical protein